MKTRVLKILKTMAVLLLPALAVPAANAAGISSSLPTGTAAGERITFTITGEGATNEAYRLSVGPAANPDDVHVVYDYHDTMSAVDWVPTDPGNYLVIGSVLDIDTGVETHAGMQFTVGPRTPLAQIQGVATPTSNPLVAYYSAPACPRGLQMRVRFFSPAVGATTTTNEKNCVSGTTMNFIVAGMRENSVYLMQHQILNGGTVVGQSPFTPFRTGTPTVAFEPVVEGLPYSIESSLIENTVLMAPIVGNPGAGVDPNIYAVDLEGNLIWYAEYTGNSFRPAGGGTIWTNEDDPVTGHIQQQLTRMDLLGNVAQRTTATQINRQLAEMGHQAINDFHHEARPLPNGHTAVLTTVERVLVDQQGPGEVNTLADMVIVLDEDLQVTFAWNMFDNLDTSRVSSTGDVCVPGGSAGCGNVFNGEEANDWTHSNGIAYSPTDGDLIVSVRHQDWVVKVDYADGAGTGALEWRLGDEGDFTLTTGNRDDWPSHTHDVSYVADDQILLYDNSNLRCEANTPPVDCKSRGQVWQIDETTMEATPVVNIDLQDYARAVGSAQLLVNGNYYFNSGLHGFSPQNTSYFQEFTPGGTEVTRLEINMWTYRSHRLISLYALPPYWDIPQ